MLTNLARHTAAFIVGAITVLCGSCGTVPTADQPQSYLDQSTAATVTMVGRPLVFARERPNFAVHMRDYITLAAASIDRAGKIQLVLIAYFWTTFDPHARDDGRANKRQDEDRHPDELTLIADDRRITFAKLNRTAHEAGIEERVNASRSLTAQTRTGDTELDYSIWEDRRAALAQWVHEVGGS
jgi:hypothetical protein